MSAELLGVIVTIAIFLIGVIFAAGKVLAVSRKESEQIRFDMNRIGAKCNEQEKSALRRYHNVCMVLMATEDDKERRLRIAGLLEE